MKNRRWGLPLLLILTGVLLVALSVVQLQDRAEKQKMQELRDEAAVLEKQRDTLTVQRDRTEREYNDRLHITATEQLLFLELDERLYSEIFPKMQERGMIGVLGLSASEFPGENGKIRRGEFDALLGTGWGLCLVCEDGSRFSDWDREMSQRLREAGIAKPAAVYFTEEQYSTVLDEEILRCGYTVAVHHGEDRQEMFAGDANEALWRTGAHPWNYTGVKTGIDENVSAGGEHCYTLRFSEGREEYNERSFENMLGYVDAYRESGMLVVTDFAAARLAHDPGLNGAAALRAEKEQVLTQMQAQIDRLNEQIQTIYARWNGEKE